MAGTQWKRGGKRNGIPPLPKILTEAEEWRQSEFDQSKQAWGELEGRIDDFSVEIRSVAHDAKSCGHDRDYRGVALFFKELTIRSNITARVFDLRNRPEGGYILTVNVFARKENQKESARWADMLAFRHHMRWVKLRGGNLPADVRDWGKNFKDHIRHFEVTGWRRKLSEGGDVHSGIAVSGCRFCKQRVQKLCAPGQFYGSCANDVARNQLVCPKEEPYSCGMAARSTDYPILNMDWRNPGPTCPLAGDFVKNADVEFSPSAVQKMETVGNRLVRQYGDVRLSARTVQEIEMRKIAPQAEAASQLSFRYPDLADNNKNLHTIGALPHFRVLAPENPRPAGLPYDASKTLVMVEEIWSDVRAGRLLVAPSHVPGKRHR